MYLSHYNLDRKPFQLTTDPGFLWLGEKYKEALATLKYGVVDQKGFLLVTGDAGTGKTTLINALLAWLGNDVIVANISNPILEEMDFFNTVAEQFNINKYFSSKADFLKHFRRFLNACYSKKSMDLRRSKKGNGNQDLIASTIVGRRKNLLLWSAAVIFTVIVMVLTWPSNKNRSLKENNQKPVTSMRNTDTSSALKAEQNFSSLTAKDQDALTIPALSKSVALNDTSKTNDTVGMLMVSKDKDDIVKAENSELDPAQDRVLPGRYTAFLHYSYEENKNIIEALAVFLKNKGFKVHGITRVNYKNRDIRYFHSEDKSGALVFKKYLT